MCGDVQLGRPDLFVLVVAVAGTDHPDPLRDRLGRLVTRVDVRLYSTDRVRGEPIAGGGHSFSCEPASLVVCTDDPRELRQISNDRRLDEPDCTLLAAHTNDPVAPVLARCAGPGGLLLVTSRKLTHGRRVATGELVERTVRQHRHHLIGVTHTKWTQHQTLGLDRRNNHLRTLSQVTRWVDLWTFEINVGSHHFWERHGFVLVELTDGRDNEEYAPDHRYRWPR